MKSYQVRGVALALGVLILTANAQAQESTYAPSLLPLPQGDYHYPMTHATSLWQQPANPELPAPVDEAHSMPSGQPATPQHGVMDHHSQADSEYHGESAGGDHGSCPNCGGHHAAGACPAGSSYVDGGSYYGSNPYPYSQYGHKGWWHGLFGNWIGCGASAWLGHCDASAAACSTGDRCGWFAGANGLVMTRDNANRYYFSFENSVATEHIQLLDIRDAEMDWSGGFEGRFGRYFNCGQNAWEVVYWGLYPGRQQFTLFGTNFANPLDGIHDWGDIDIFDPTVPGNVAADGWVDNADAHRIQRDFEFHNIELNLLNYAGCMAYGDCGQPKFRYHWGLGVRYFRFDEDLLFSAKEAGSGTVFDGSVNQVDYFVDVENNLIGGQVSGDAEYWLTRRLSLTMGAKLGVYANHINHHSVISSAGNIAFVNNGPLTGGVWNVNTNKNDIAMLGELNVGLDWQINCRWSATLGYRAVAATGVALTSNQIPNDLRGINDVAIIDSNGSLILHGGYAGIEYNY